MDVTSKPILDYVVEAYKNGMIPALVIGVIIGIIVTNLYFRLIHNKTLENNFEAIKKELEVANNRAEESEKKFKELNEEIKKYQSDFYAGCAVKPDSYDSLYVADPK